MAENTIIAREVAAVPSPIEPAWGHISTHRAARSVGLSAILVGALLAALALGLLHGAPATAHAQLDHSDPPADAVLATSPPQITLWFVEAIEPDLSGATVDDQTGHPIAGVSSHPGPAPDVLLVTVPPQLPNGTYSVVWHTVSKDDGHAAQGYFAFAVGTQANFSAVVRPVLGVGGPPSWVQAIARWLAYIGLAVTAAIWPVWLLVVRPAISPAWQVGPRLTRRVRRLAVGAIALALTGDLVALLVQAGTLSGGFTRAIAITLRDTRYGRIWLLRIGLLFAYSSLLMIAAWWRPWRHRAGTWATLALAAALPLPFSLVAHAAGQPSGRAAAIAADLLHLLAASLWVGGLVVLVAGLGPTLHDLTPAGRRAVLVRAIPRFSLLALTAWTTLAVTGLYSAWLQVGNWTGLRTTAYGHTLTIKALLLVPVLALGAFNLLVVTGRLRQVRSEHAMRAWSRHFMVAISAEVVLATSVLAMVGLLTSQVPAREVLVSRGGQMVLAFKADGRTATLSVAPATAGFNRDRLTLSAPVLPATATALLRLTPPDPSLGLKDIDLVRATGNEFEAQTSDFSVLGTWTVKVIVRAPGQNDWTATRSLTIGATPPTAHAPRAPWRFNLVGLLGLVLLVGGMAGIVVAGLGMGRSPRRTVLGGAGLAVLVVGLLLLLQGHARAAPALPAHGPAHSAAGAGPVGHPPEGGLHGRPGGPGDVIGPAPASAG